MVKKHDTHTTRAQIQGTHQKKQSKTPPIWVFILIIVLAAAAYFIFALPTQETTEDAVLVLVNGEEIYQSQLDTQWQALPVQAKLQLDREELLKQLVQERLLIQEAEKLDIEISDEEVQAFLDAQLRQTGTTEEQFTQILKQQGTSIDDVKAIYRRQLTIATLFEEFMGDEPFANDEDILAYYQENKNQFFQDEQVTVRHILIQANNDSEMPELVLEIQNQLQEANNENFCDLVNEYSMDLASRENCGEYTFARGVMVPTFEDASFALEIGQTDLVESQFGYHIILKVNETPSGYAGLDTVLNEYPGKPTVRMLVEQTVIQQQARAVFDSYVGELEEKAEILYVAVQ